VRTCRGILLLTLLTALMISAAALAQHDSSDLTKRDQDDKILRERIKNLGLIIPDDVKKRFEELDKQPPPVLLNLRLSKPRETAVPAGISRPRERLNRPF